MDRDAAVKRVNAGLGFRAVGHSLTDEIIARMLEAQRDLEHGKTIPKFLLQEDQDLILSAGSHSIALPDKFLRLDDNNLPHYDPAIPPPAFGLVPMYLEKMNYSDLVKRLAFGGGGLASGWQNNMPRAFVIRKSTIDFVVTPSQDIHLKWNYYKGAMTLETNVTNSWLDEASGAPEWLIGETGYRIALDARDKDAVDLFSAMITRARAAAFGHQLQEEESGGPFVMGAKN